MPESPRPFSVPKPQPVPERLESWKEIAAYLGREVRTVQGWEKNEGLPIHRHQHAKQGSVYALRSELDAWRATRKTVPEPDQVTDQVQPPGNRRRWLLACLLAVALVLAGAVLWRARTAASPRESVSSVVVLPFLDMSAQKDQEYFSDGLTEEIIDALSRVPNLRVVARTSAFAFKGKSVDIRQIGRQLNVDGVLEGSVRKAGDQLRITAQLNRVSDGTHFWSRTYDRQLRDVFAVQQEISQTIAGQLRTGETSRKQPTQNLDAYARYQEGLYFFNQHQVPDSYWKAIDRYKQAIQLDPKYARAYAGMADAYAYLAENFAVWPREAMPKAKEAAEKAVALDDNLAEAHTSLGIVKLDYEWDRQTAQREFLRAIQLSPGSGYIKHWYAHSLEAQGRLEEATKEMQAALALDPLSLIIHWDVANELLSARKFTEAAQFLDKARELFPGYPVLEWERASAYYQQGDKQSAIRTLEALVTSNAETSKDPTLLTMKGLAAAWAGRRDEARAILNQLEQLRKAQYVEPMTTLGLCSALGDHEALMRWARRAYDDRSTMFLYAPMTWIFYDDDPEVKAFLAKNLPAS